MRMFSSNAGFSEYAIINEPVPIFASNVPGLKTLSPTAAHCWSPPAVITSIDFDKPVFSTS